MEGKLKIRNPVLRWFAGLGVIIVLPVSAFVAIHWIGKLTLPLFWKIGMFVEDRPFDTFGAGFFFSLIFFLVVVTLFHGVKVTGDACFNQVESQKADSQPAEN